MNIIHLLTFIAFVIPSLIKPASAAAAKSPAKAVVAQLQANPLPVPTALSQTQAALEGKETLPAMSASRRDPFSDLVASFGLSQSHVAAAAQAPESLLILPAMPTASRENCSSAALSGLVSASGLSHGSSGAGSVGVMISSPMPAQATQLQDLKVGTVSVPRLRPQTKQRRNSLPLIRPQTDVTEHLPSLELLESGANTRAVGKIDDKKEIVKTDQQDKNKKKRDSSDASSTRQKTDSGDLESKDSPVQSESLLWSAFNIVGSGLGILERQTRKMVQTDSAHLLHLQATGQLTMLPKADQIALVARALQANATKMKTTDGTAFQSRIKKQIAVVDATAHRIDADVAKEAIEACELFTKDLNTLIAKLKEKSSDKA